jgi:hypothetical protein
MTFPMKSAVVREFPPGMKFYFLVIVKITVFVFWSTVKMEAVSLSETLVSTYSFTLSSLLKMEAVYSSLTLVSIYNCTRFSPENRGSILLRNVYLCRQVRLELHPRRPIRTLFSRFLLEPERKLSPLTHKLTCLCEKIQTTGMSVDCVCPATDRHRIVKDFCSLQ